ncbi:MAG: hypothetical protein HY064_16475 [Bacteroidetes bacterium]|nr:hypothetical protein [Bacteroidota bacterium]
MRKIILLPFFLFPFAPLSGQDQNQQQSSSGDNTATMTSLAGLLRAQLTVTPAFKVGATSGNNSVAYSNQKTNIYLHGTLEYYFDQRFSMRGDGYYFLVKDKNPGGLISNHSSQIGFSWHLIKKEFAIDPFIGLRCGLSFVQTNPINYKLSGDSLATVIPTNMQITPVWGPHAGINFFGAHVFHFFIEAQYLIGNYRPDMAPSRNLNEIRISAGLGWNWVFVHKEAEVRQTI